MSIQREDEFDEHAFLNQQQQLKDSLYYIFNGSKVVSASAANNRDVIDVECFKIILRDFNVQDAVLTSDNIMSIFERNSTSGQMSFEQFVKALLQIALFKHPPYTSNVPKKEIFKQFVQSITQFDVLIGCYANGIAKLTHNMNYDIEKIFFEHENVIRMIFDKYSEYAGDKQGSGAQRLITMHRFSHFVRDFNIADPDMLDLPRLFKSLGSGKSNDAELLSLSQADLLQFCDLLVRMAAIVYTKHQQSKDTVDLPSKVRKLFHRIGVLFISVFKTTVNAILVDLTKIEPPLIKSITPSRVSFGEKLDVVITGYNFDRRRGGVTVKFGNDETPATYINQTTVRCSAPIKTKPSQESSVETVFTITRTESVMEYEVTTLRQLVVRVSAANNVSGQKKFGDESFALFTYMTVSPKFIITAELGKAIFENIFTTYCRKKPSKRSGPSSIEMQSEQWCDLARDMDDLADLKFTKPIDDAEKIFYKCAVKEQKTFSMDFERFIQAVLFLCMERNTQLHPVNFLEKLLLHRNKLILIKQNLKEQQLTTDLMMLKLEAQSIPTRQYRQLMVLNGPMIVGYLDETPGPLVGCNGKAFQQRNSSFSYRHLDECTENSIRSHLSMSVTMDHAISRLLNLGIDICARGQSEKATHGRSWHILSGDRSRKLGVLLDIPGQLSSIDFQPREAELCSPVCTICVYDSPDSATFLSAYRIFTAAHSSMEDIRNSIEKIGWKLKTAIYKVGI